MGGWEETEQVSCYTPHNVQRGDQNLAGCKAAENMQGHLAMCTFFVVFFKHRCDTVDVRMPQLHMKTIGTHVQPGGHMAETRMTLLADLLSASTSGSRRVCKYQTL